MRKALLALLGLAAPLLAGDQPAPIEVTKENAPTFYRAFRRMTGAPHYVPQSILQLCVMPSPQMMEREKQKTGPHFQTTVHIYANPAAETAITTRQAVFPVGAVVVKEKLGPDNLPEAVGGMIKRPPGYDPANGDWEYFYSAGSAGFSRGRLSNCAGCHAGARTTDYVFGNWKRAEWKITP